MKRTIKDEGVVVEFNGKFWGIQHEDGHSRSDGWGPIENACVEDPKYAKQPRDFTYIGSYYTKELEKGRLVRVTKTTTFITEGKL